MTTDINETEEKTDASGIKDLPVSLEAPGFAADEMIACEKCGRSNPPTRLKCFYCGTDIAVTAKYDEHIRPALRKLEEWEKGFNVILLQRDGGADLRSIGKEVGLEPDAVKGLVDAGGPMPLVRVESRQGSAVILDRLKKFGFECCIVADENLDTVTPPRRLRAVDFTGDGITVTDFNTGERTSIAADDLVLIVVGQLFELKTHSFEKRKKGKSEIIDQSDISSDESVIDIYANSSMSGFRIYESGFDFSCLGGEKSLLATENSLKLLRRMCQAAPAAKLVDNYPSIRDALDAVWELSSHKDFDGLRRSGFGKTDFGNTVTVSNHMQFNRFSRMQRQLI